MKLLDADGNEIQLAGLRAAGQHHVPAGLDHHGEGRPAGRRRRGARADSAGDVEDARHHGRPAARGRAVRGALRRRTPGTLAEVTGTVSFGKDTKGKQRLVITDLDGVAHEYLIPKDKHVTAHDGQVVNKGEIDRRRSGGSARHPAAARGRGARALHHRRGAGRLPAAGREDQRQAHRGDRAADAAPRAGQRRRRLALHPGRAGRALGSAGRERQG